MYKVILILLCTNILERKGLVRGKLQAFSATTQSAHFFFFSEVGSTILELYTNNILPILFILKDVQHTIERHIQLAGRGSFRQFAWDTTAAKQEHSE